MLNRSQLLLLLWAGNAVSVSLSQYEKITNVPNTCFSIWNKEVPGCKRADFTGSGCSPLCFAGLTVIDAEVQSECADVDAGRHTLLGEFLTGYGTSTVCDGGAEVAKTSTSTSTSQTTKAPHQSTDTHTAQQRTATATVSQKTTAEPASTEATQSTTSVSSSSSSSSSTSTTTSASSTTTAGTTTTQQADITTSATTSSSSPTSDPDAKGFGGVGDAYDILGGHSSAGQLETPWISLVVAAICAVGMGSVV
ncbi:uncharacterized protein TRUGW13939_11361 [Talaromyces rugulosus]|uniref:Extracellular membrane protein CFEM domain-containing protein n=1 Tax=Talaromyces rugulosus TaxID=121627 RepID=A0A7H8RDW9_TALRU|nr:uncharacterized protein TRUGW13939_11361 [Talaromyces rugulosus]QKX64188.1 hypothetical protein TRUGW13939_11361 [Talaromyces rugulosus]